ncbi:MAG: hypothetical protein QM775_13765 [Pirellulales bacterium]
MSALKPFEYTYKSWDKLRLVDLPKTGLGEALKKYELAKSRLENGLLIHLYYEAVKALSEVETARETAISKCGLPHFKPLKKVLEAADASEERDELNGMLGGKLGSMVDEMVKEAKEVRKKLEARIKVTIDCITQVKAGTATPEIKKTAYKLINTESSFVVPGISDVGEAAALRGKRTALIKDFPEIFKRFDEEVVGELGIVQKKAKDFQTALEALDAFKDKLKAELASKGKEE